LASLGDATNPQICNLQLLLSLLALWLTIAAGIVILTAQQSLVAPFPAEHRE
jgi:hypothetical protein